MSWKVRVAVVLFAFAVSAVPALAQQPPGAQAAAQKQAELTVGGGYNAAMAADGSQLVVGTWNWYLLVQTWTYWDGYVWKVWCNTRNTGDYFSVNADHALAHQLRSAITNDHWLGIWWDSSSTWSNAVVWWY